MDLLVVFRGQLGDWISSFARNIGITGSAEAELWVLRNGLTLCLQLRLPAVVVEFDAQAIANILCSFNSYNGDLCPLVDDYREVLGQIPQIKMLHCFRKANFCADAMAKLGSMLEQDFILFTAPPPLLFSLLEFDKTGLFCNKQCTVTLVTQFLIYSVCLPQKKKPIEVNFTEVPGFYVPMMTKVVACVSMVDIARILRPEGAHVIRNKLKDT